MNRPGPARPGPARRDAFCHAFQKAISQFLLTLRNFPLAQFYNQPFKLMYENLGHICWKI